ncbi:hypothetical protein [Gelatiniphilus marinus]|uniref:Lipocalin-like domain-containing protein n=1 Tax=Gelatiniphilus marinus TaxID=1759464 RepID=A0ABW5JNS6_9FLAO
MKNLVLMLSLTLAIGSCSQNEENIQTDASVYGTWQLIKSTANNVDGSPSGWQQVENGYKIIFNKDFSYESEIHPSDCNGISSSTYAVQNEPGNSTIETTIVCDNPNKTFKSKHSYSFEDATYLILTPIEPSCPEGCAFMFKKVN